MTEPDPCHWYCTHDAAEEIREAWENGTMMYVHDEESAALARARMSRDSEEL